MRVLLSTIGSRGDVQPLVALALQLRAPVSRSACVCRLTFGNGSTASASLSSP